MHPFWASLLSNIASRRGVVLSLRHGWLDKVCATPAAVEHTRAAPHDQSVNASNASAATRDSALESPLTLHAPGLAITRRLGLFQACSRSALKAQRHPDGNSIVQVE